MKNTSTIIIYFILLTTLLFNITGCDESLLGLPPIYTDFLRNDPNGVLNVFPNKTLRDAVFRQLMAGKPDSVVLTIDDLEHLSYLTINSSYVDNLEGIQFCRGLVKTK